MTPTIHVALPACTCRTCPFQAPTSEHDHTARQLLYAGDRVAFLQWIASKYDTAQDDVWRSGRLATWVRHAPRMEDDGVRACYYDTLKAVMQECVDTRRAWWDEERCAAWIDLFVTQRLPWFLCSSWNHLSMHNVCVLYDASLHHLHMSNVHQLLRAELVPCWLTNFWNERHNTDRFFAQPCKAFKHLLRGHLRHHAPWGDPRSLPFRNVVTSLLDQGHGPVLSAICRIEAEEAQQQQSPSHVDDVRHTEPLLTHFLHYHAITRLLRNNHTAMLEWLVAEFATRIADVTLRCTMSEWSAIEWHLLFREVQPHHVDQRLHTGHRSRTRHAQMALLLRLFHLSTSRTRTPSTSWREMLMHVSNHHTVLNFLAISLRGHELLQYAVDRVVDQESAARAELSPAQSWYTTLEVSSQEGWTSLANAARWGTADAVAWLLDAGARITFTCFTYNSRLTHNLLSLAFYNSRDDVLTTVLCHSRCRPHVYEWLQSGVLDIMSGILSPWISIRGAVTKLLLLEHHVARVWYAKTALLRAFVNLHGRTVSSAKRPVLEHLLQMPGEISDASVVCSMLMILYDARHRTTETDPPTAEHCLRSLHAAGMTSVPRIYSLLLGLSNMFAAAEDCLHVLPSVIGIPHFHDQMRMADQATIDIFLHSLSIFIQAKPQDDRLYTLSMRVNQFMTHARKVWHWNFRHASSSAIHALLSVRGAASSQFVRTMLQHGTPLVLVPYDRPMTGAHMRNEVVYRRIASAYRVVQRVVRRVVRRRRVPHCRHMKKVHFEMLCQPSRPAARACRQRRGSRRFALALQSVGARLPLLRAVLPHAVTAPMATTFPPVASWEAFLDSIGGAYTAVMLQVQPVGESYATSTLVNQLQLGTTAFTLNVSGILASDDASPRLFITDVMHGMPHSLPFHRMQLLQQYQRGMITDQRRCDDREECATPHNIVALLQQEQAAFETATAPRTAAPSWWAVQTVMAIARDVPQIADALATSTVRNGPYSSHAGSSTSSSSSSSSSFLLRVTPLAPPSATSTAPSYEIVPRRDVKRKRPLTPPSPHHDHSTTTIAPARPPTVVAPV